MRYVYYASLYTFWAMMPDDIPDRGGWAKMATFLEECLLVIQLGGDDRFKLKKVNPVVDEGYETGDGSECGGGFRGCVGDEYSEDEELSELESESEHECGDDDADPESEMETVIDDEEYITTDEGENDMADGLVPETLGWGRMNAESGLRLDERGLGQRAWALKNRLKYGTTFHWDDENGEPTFDDVRCQLWQMVCHDLREIEIKHGGRVYTKPALGFR
ncbi:hypothetical protein APSETT445_008832 [Aspergillus pseudonomiae]